MVTRFATCTCVVMLVCAGTLASGQPADVDGLLALAPAPGVEALLLAHARDPRVTRRWRELLTHEDVHVREAAARALGVTNVRAAAPDVMQALASERDPNVISELLQTLAIVSGDDDLLPIYAHLDRIGDTRALPLLDGLAAARPDAAARHVLVSEPLRMNVQRVRVVYERIARTRPAAADRIDADPGSTTTPEVLEDIIMGAAGARRKLPAGLVVAGLQLRDAGRLATLSYLATLYGNPGQVVADQSLRAGAPGKPPADASPETLWIAALHHRWFGRDDETAVTALIDALPDVAWIKSTPAAVLSVLSPAEREAYATRVGLSNQATRTLLEVSPGEPLPQAPASAATTLYDVPAPVLRDLGRATGCRPQEADERFASVQYRPDRRPAAIALEPEPWSPGCDRMAQAVLAMAYGAPPREAKDRTAVLIRLDDEFTRCLADRHAPAEPTSTSTTPGWTPPRKQTDRRPVYPDVAVKNRLQGVVSIDARIEASGCVAEARVVRAVHPFLDTAALRAVSHWTYSPTTLNGEPVPILMTVDVNFSLR